MITESKVLELIQRYRLTPHSLAGEGSIKVGCVPKGVTQAQLIAEVKQYKPAIIAYWRRQRAAEAEESKAREERRLKHLPGLYELDACADAWAQHREAVTRQFESQDGMIRWPAEPAHTYAELAAKYPAAAAYRAARGYANAANYHKAAAGRKAMEIIEAGGDYAAAIEEMEHWADDIDIWN